MEHAMGWKKGAFFLSACCFTLGPWTCLVQSESATSSMLKALKIDHRLTLLFMVIIIGWTIAGGLRGVSSKVERVVPKLAIAYITVALILVIKHAFTPMAGVGGFAGATVMSAIRFGIAGGIYSNDAGTGYGIVAHAAARITAELISPKANRPTKYCTAKPRQGKKPLVFSNAPGSASHHKMVSVRIIAKRAFYIFFI